VQTTKQSGRFSLAPDSGASQCCHLRRRRPCAAHSESSRYAGCRWRWVEPNPYADHFGQDFPLRTTGLANVPIPSMVTLTVSPSSMGPTPAGVPVRMMSPGNNVITAETHSTIAPTS